MIDLRTAAQQALEALESGVSLKLGWMPDCEDAITALKAALADGDNLSPGEPVQERVALNDGRLWQYPDGSIGIGSAPPQRKPLTGEEILSLFRTSGSPTAFARAIERAHGIAE